MTSFVTRASVIAAACLAIAIVGEPAFARSTGEQITVQILRGDLDLTTDAGVRVAYSRIRMATRRVCGPRPVFLYTRLWRDCTADFADRAVAAFDCPKLTALHESKSRRTPGNRARRRV
jgi:UrcA family protein